MRLLGRLTVAASVAWLVVIVSLEQPGPERAWTVAFYGCGWTVARGGRD